ncbi:MAG: SUMF1/EgtB/PvdO family nonheme iron enzyme [Verrucomicrobiota bacterium]|nr:SUMF1/EgtB/PvdO family nonheme iron enzyme [Verrucomicrobiota bacterium]MDY5596750.1 SUMF1/EgtB/PvdO family nonheme iron enzyme [Kiritimatiellia bacterium]
MKTTKLAVAAFLLFVGEAFAASAVSDVIARQRWPWSGKVDIDYTVTGDTTDVDFTATWDGQPTPVLLGTAFRVEAGQHRFEFDPAAAGLADRTTTGFAVTAQVAGFDAHRYLVLDLVNGGYSYLSEPPAGGWTDEHKSTKMVFARIPAGTATLGHPKEMLEHLWPGLDSHYCTIQAERTVTYTEDFYMGVHKFTQAQYGQLVNGTPGGSHAAKTVSYYALRGATNANEQANVDWPSTGYKVAPDSIVALLRAKANGALVIDLSEEEQWEYAARCHTTTYWPNGGTITDSLSTLTNVVSEIASWYHDPNPGVPKVPNPWGLHDVVGGGTEWTLTCAPQKNNTGPLPRHGRSGGTDSVGPLHTGNYDDYDARRVIRSSSGNYASATLFTLSICTRQIVNPASTSIATTRFCIHLKPLDFNEHN